MQRQRRNILTCVPRREPRGKRRLCRRSPTSSFSPDFPCHGVPGFLHQGGDLLLPTRLLASEEPDRHLQDSTGIVERKSAAPSLRDVGEVFLGEGPGGSSHPVARKRGAEGHSYELGQESGGIEDGVSLGEEIEIEESEAVAVQEEMIRHEI